LQPVSVARIVLSYDGTDFHGWQIQPGLRTVQGEVQRCVERLLGEELIPPGAGRTDAGVHARGQVCSVPLGRRELLARLRTALPRMVPTDIAVHEIGEEAASFHARFSATGRRYSYRLLLRPDPFLRRDHWILRGPLDVDRMIEACVSLRGPHDCTSFCRAESVEEGRMVCRIESARLDLCDGAIVFEIHADRFVHSMVRTIVGTLVEIGRGRKRPDAFGNILAARDRRAAGPTAPPHGLCLEEVLYGPSPHEVPSPAQEQ
jgi:tRNA pseudouridine38-40 synthase